jgi:hypothetical protein
MSAGTKWMKLSRAILMSAAFLCAISLCTISLCAVNLAGAETVQNKHKTKKQPPPPLPSGPTGRPVQQIPLDNIAAVPPQVTYENNQLTIVAPNSTLADILRAVRKQTGAEIEIPSAPERVVTHLGPGPARAVVAELLNGSRFNYVILGSATDDSVLTRIVLVARSGQDSLPGAPGAEGPQGITQAQAGAPPQGPPQDAQGEDAADDNNADDSADQQGAEEQQPTPPPDQGAKTPQQMLQEMQQRQMQLQQQQQQNPGQPLGPGRPAGPIQQN